MVLTREGQLIGVQLFVNGEPNIKIEISYDSVRQGKKINLCVLVSSTKKLFQRNLE